MISSGVLILLGLVGMVLFWLDGARARELATGLCRKLCERQQLQFLEGTASLHSVRIIRAPQGVRFKRLFRFEFSASGGTERDYGYITITGSTITHFEIAGQSWIEASGNTEPTAQETKSGAKVIPFHPPEKP